MSRFRRLWTNEAIRESIQQRVDSLGDINEWGWADPVPDPEGAANGLPMREDARLAVHHFWVPEPGTLPRYKPRYGYGTEPDIDMTLYGGVRVTFRRDDIAGVTLIYPCRGIVCWRQWTKTKEADGVFRYEDHASDCFVEALERTSGMLYWLVKPIIKAGGLHSAVDLHD